MHWDEWVRTIAAAFTPIAVFAAAWQVRFNHTQAKLSFEDDLNREYRNIAESLPLDTFHRNPDVSKALSSAEQKAMFRYFDLSNEQLRLAATSGRITGPTAAAWREGIRDNMSLRRFQEAWDRRMDELESGYFTSSLTS